MIKTDELKNVCQLIVDLLGPAPSCQLAEKFISVIFGTELIEPVSDRVTHIRVSTPIMDQDKFDALFNRATMVWAFRDMGVSEMTMTILHRMVMSDGEQ